jgi:periplasmic divalent cation tolerance protein
VDPADDGVCELVITGPDRLWLTEFALRLVDDRLCACGQVVAPVRSVFRWEGKVQEESEARVWLHTRGALVPTILERVEREHPYDVPCVLVLPVAGGNAAYLDWVRAETDVPQPAGSQPTD